MILPLFYVLRMIQYSKTEKYINMNLTMPVTHVPMNCLCNCGSASLLNLR